MLDTSFARACVSDVDLEQLLAGAPRERVGGVLVTEPDELIAAWLAAPRRTRVLQVMHWAGGHTRLRMSRAHAAWRDGPARPGRRHRAIGGGASGQAPSGVSASLRRWAMRTAARLAGRSSR
jgi:hypothetical protein